MPSTFDSPTIVAIFGAIAEGTEAGEVFEYPVVGMVPASIDLGANDTLANDVCRAVPIAEAVPVTGMYRRSEATGPGRSPSERS